MTPEPSALLKKIRFLSQALLVSGVLNIGALALLSYWILRERPPTPYCELKPATYAQQQLPLADYRSCGEVIAHLQLLSFDQLVGKLQQAQLVENGYTERDLALSALVNFHHFDITRALPKEAQLKQTRVLMWKNLLTGESIPLTIYPGLTHQQFHSIIAFAKTERWPMTPKGLFLLLQKQKKEFNIDPSLVETFTLTPEFMTIELIFKRIDMPLLKQKLLEVVLEGNWPLLEQFVSQQRQLNDLSSARRQKFLLDYMKQGSEAAAYLLLDVEEEFAVKKLDDAQVTTLLQLLPIKTLKSEQFALAMLTSPRSTGVWQQASLRLYEYAGEPIPSDWNYRTSLKRFVLHKGGKEEGPKLSSPSSTQIVSLASPKMPEISAPIPVKPAQEEIKMEVSGSKANSKSISVASKKEVVAKKPAPSCRLYIVQEGDSLWKISRRFGVDMEVLKDRNQLQSTGIQPGTVLKIP